MQCPAQQPFIFIPAPQNEATLTSLAAKFEKKYRDFISTLPSENKKDYAEIYQHSWENVKEKFNKREIYTSTSAQQYLDALVSEIKNSNPSLQPLSFDCFFSRSGVPNASYIGEGVILFNMGLFTKLRNESQAAFVICHEISHFYLKHNDSRITKYITLLNSDAVQKELYKIKNSEYKKRQELDKLLEGLSFSTMRHSRDHEGQADSMALVFMRHTRFDVNESLTALALLDSIDADNIEMGDCLQKAFDSKEYAFRKKWLQKEEGLLGGHAQLETDNSLEDSLKTHPDCLLRVKMLEPEVKRIQNRGKQNINNHATFEELKKVFNYEIIEYAFTSGNYTRSLFYTMKFLQSNSSDPYLIMQAGKIFNGFYTGQKTHTLGKLIDLPSPFFSNGYNQLLQFVQNLYLKDFSQISYYFLKQYNPSLDYYIPFRDTYNASIQNTQ